MVDMDKKYQIENDVRTLKESELIKKDPKRMKSAMIMMNMEIQAMQNTMEDNKEKMGDKMFSSMKKKEEQKMNGGEK